MAARCKQPSLSFVQVKGKSGKIGDDYNMVKKRKILL